MAELELLCVQPGLVVAELKVKVPFAPAVKELAAAAETIKLPVVPLMVML